MRRCLIIIAVLFSTISASAQLVTYEPVIVDRNGNRINADGSPYSKDYYQQNTPQTAPEEVITTRGYYYSSRYQEWSSLLIKVELGARRVKLVGIKERNGWRRYQSHAREISLYDSDFVKQNFTYRADTIEYGTIYF